MSESADLAVVGAGISGLAAAWEGLRRGARVMVLDAAPESGGKLRTSPFAGVALDEAADAFLARVPGAVELCAELGITSELVAPATGAAFVFLERLVHLDAQLLGAARDGLAPGELADLARQAEQELRSFRDRMTVEAHAAAVSALMDRLVRERFQLPFVSPE